MGDTPKATKTRGRPSLSLNKRLTRTHSSPQNGKSNKDCLNSAITSLDTNDGTPPHKKMNLDDSYDSPTNFELSESPTMFLSQNFYPNSPEVGWRWTQDEIQTNIDKNQKQDSGISSNLSSSSEDATLKRKKQDKRQVLAYLKKDQNKSRLKLTQMHKANKMAVLRERMSKLEEQLKIISSGSTAVLKPESKPIEDSSENKKQNKEIFVTKDSETVDMADFDFDNVFNDSLILDNIVEEHATKAPTVNDIHKNDDIFQDSIATKELIANELQHIDDFFNDSDSDSLLIAATQQIESSLPKIPETKISNILTAELPNDKLKTSSKTKTPKATSKEKRSSLYMKFFEDDEDEDLFVALDDDLVLKASQSKTRSPFQRYKSMPLSRTSTTTTASNSTTTSSQTISSSGPKIFEPPCWNSKHATRETIDSSNRPAIKRHASSHAISPTTTNLRSWQMHRRD